MIEGLSEKQGDELNSMFRVYLCGGGWLDSEMRVLFVLKMRKWHTRVGVDASL